MFNTPNVIFLCHAIKMNVLNDHTIMLPVELYHIIAAESVEAYRAMLSVPAFARTIDVSTKYDYMIHFGYSVRVDSIYIRWFLNDQFHRVGGPALEPVIGRWRSMWCYKGRLHRTGGPAIEFSDDNYERWRYGTDPEHTRTREELEEWYHHGTQHLPAHGPAGET